MTLILASSSPRRRDLLKRLGLPYVVEPSLVLERPPRPGEDPASYASELARQKAGDVALRHPGAVVIGADTVVAVQSEILGKPADSEDALRMLRLLRARSHLVATAVVVICDGQILSGVSTATVRMRDASDADLQRYIATGEPMDKAGGYAIQGTGGSLVEEVHGCYNAVVGLPLARTAELLQSCGLGPVSPSECCGHCRAEAR